MGWGANKPLISLTLGKLATTAVESKQQTLVQCNNLTIFTPDFNRVVLGNISSPSSPTTASSASSAGVLGVDIKIQSGDRLLVVGPSGSGKSSLVRAIAGLWRVGYGTVTWDTSLSASIDDHAEELRQAPKSVFFLPQKPYNLLGDLRRQIMYPTVPTTGPVSNQTVYQRQRIDQPNTDADTVQEAGEQQQQQQKATFPPDEVFLNILKQVRLENLAGRMGNGSAEDGLRVNKDWSKTLSVGEQQRLAFARVLYNRPKVLVLDGKCLVICLSALLCF